jgi:hypothetical protein
MIPLGSERSSSASAPPCIVTIELNADNEQVLAYETGLERFGFMPLGGGVVVDRVKSLVCVLYYSFLAALVVVAIQRV